MRLNIGRVSAVALVLLFVTAFLWAQGNQTAASAPIRLNRINRALEQAGAPALSDSQKQQLNALVSQYRASRSKAAPDPVVQSARKELEAAILSRNTSGVSSAAAVIAAQASKRMSERLQDEANLVIQALNILTDQQVTALRNQFGNTGLLRVFRGAWIRGGAAAGNN